MPSSRRNAHGSFKKLGRILFLVGGFGGPPPGNFWIRGPQMVHSNAILGHFTPIPIPPPPKKISLQIYTDLKNGPGSWKKVWNQTKVWRFCPLDWCNMTSGVMTKWLSANLQGQSHPKLKKSRFSTWWPWPLTYDLGHRTWPRYYPDTPLCQIWCLYVKRFSCERAEWRTHGHTHTQTGPILYPRPLTREGMKIILLQSSVLMNMMKNQC